MARSLLVLFALVASAVPAQAEYMLPETEQVPVERLIANLEAKLEEEPADAQLWHHLARVHAAAYAWKAAELRATTDGELFFGYDLPALPFSRVREAQDDAEQEAAQEHLEAAIANYERAHELDPEDQVVVIGLGWILAQAGKVEQAKKFLRQAVEVAWEEEGQQEAGDLSPWVTVEAAHYLLPLLDEEEDADERAELERRVEHLESLPRPVTPLAVPLATGLSAAELVDPTARVAFDLDGTGRAQRWEWLTPQAAWLVYDPQRTGRVESALTLFGSRSFLLFCRDGFEALSLLDDDGDGWLRGGELAGLALWRDVDQDGVSGAGEVLPVEECGLRGLKCSWSRQEGAHLLAPGGVELEDGSTRTLFDLVLRSRD